MKKSTMLITALGAAATFSTIAQADVCGSGLALNENIWTMISAPCAPPAGSESVSANFNDDLGTGAEYGTTWIMYKWNPATGAYEQLAADSVLEQDTGYWIYSTMGGTLKIDSTTHTTAVDPAGSGADGYYGDCAQFGWSGKPCYKIDLEVPASAGQTKWNLVGYPFVRSTPWADVHVAKSTDGGANWTDVGGPTAADEAGAGVINKNGWIYKADGSGYDVFDDSGASPSANTLLPNRSYWFQSRYVSEVNKLALLIPAPPYTVFVTSTLHTGNLGGLEGADAICQGLADASVHVSGRFRSWLSTTSVDARDRVEEYGPIQLVSGEIVAARFRDLLYGGGMPATGFIREDEQGVETGDGYVWTGSLDLGRYPGYGTTCNEWTDGGVELRGLVGSTAWQPREWYNLRWTFSGVFDYTGSLQGTFSCGDEFRIFCFSE